MKPKFTRRNLIQALGASTIGVTACTTPNPPLLPDGGGGGGNAKGKGVPPGLLRRFNLICHGMMMFSWKPADPNFITILIPTPPLDSGGQPMHVIALSRFPGGQPQEFNTMGLWELALTAAAANSFTKANSAFAKPDIDEDVVFNKDLPLTVSTNLAVIPYKIRVPYPSSVRRYGVAKYQNPPYTRTPTGPDYTTRDHNIKPGKMAGTHVFTYNRVVAATLVPPGSGMPMSFAGPVVNLHLYSQAAKHAHVSRDHIAVFNKMAGYTDTSGNMHAELDLHPESEIPSLDKDPTEGDLSEVDVADLVDFDPSPRPPTVDPASCLQGWGC